MTTLKYFFGETELPQRVPFQVNGISYPANWLELATPGDLVQHGFSKTEIADPEPSDSEVKAMLHAYANKKQAALVDGGVTVNGVFIATNERGKINLAGAQALAQLVPDHVFDWVVSDTETVQIPAADIIATAVAVGLWVQATYTTLGAVLAAIEAGNITRTSHIDDPAAFSLPAWPEPALTSP